jgi:hypothetical protein
MKLHLVSLVLASALACACKATSAAVLPPVSSTDAAADAIDHKALGKKRQQLWVSRGIRELDSALLSFADYREHPYSTKRMHQRIGDD